MSLGINSTKLTYYVVASRLSYRADTAIFVGLQSCQGDGATGSLIAGLENDNTNYRDYHAGYNSYVSRPALNTPFIASSLYDASNNTLFFKGTAATPVADTKSFAFERLNIGSRHDGTN
jgi:hypothetical protein